VTRCVFGQFGSPRRAFTLMEVMLALGLIVLLMGFTGMFAVDLGRQRSRLASASYELSGWVMIVDRLDRALTCVIAGDPSAGAGVVGGADRLVLLTRGVWLDAGLAEGDEGSVVREDLQRVSLSFDADRGVLELMSSSVDGGEGGAGSRGDGGRGAQISGVSFVRLRYYNGRAWVESFDTSSAGMLPMAVELAVWLGEIEREETVGVGADGGDGFAVGDGGGVARRSGSGRSEPMGEPDFVRVFAVPDSREPRAADDVVAVAGVTR